MLEVRGSGDGRILIEKKKKYKARTMMDMVRAASLPFLETFLLVKRL